MSTEVGKPALNMGPTNAKVKGLKPEAESEEAEPREAEPSTSVHLFLPIGFSRRVTSCLELLLT